MDTIIVLTTHRTPTLNGSKKLSLQRHYWTNLTQTKLNEILAFLMKKNTVYEH